MVDLIGWLSYFAVVVAFWLSAVKNRPVPFLWVNVVAMFTIGATNVLHGAWQELALNVTFGVTSGWGLWKRAKRSTNPV